MSLPKRGNPVAMARTDDDSWGITDGVGQTALGVAMARADEATSECPLFTDPYAQLFLDAATERGWRRPPAHMVERIRSISAYTASRTKWFDEFFIAAGASGIEQAVILAAGLDARAWRLPWVDGSVVYEIDQPKVLEFKTRALAERGVRPAVSRYLAVPADLRHDWPKALRDAGFDASQPTAWAAEALLPYLPADAQDLLFDRIHQHSARDSRIAVESFGAAFFDPEYLASRRERLRQWREQTGAPDAGDVPDTEDLWFIEERTDVAAWLTDHCWDVTSVDAAELMTRYGRGASGEVDDTTPRTVFVEAVLS
jgi:methyltransferase (TIGR00027 family)